MESVEVTTVVQAQFHLEREEVLVAKTRDGSSVFVRKARKNEYEIVVQPRFGRGTEYEGDGRALHESLETMFCGGMTFQVFEGGRLEARQATVWERIVDWIRRVGRRG